MDRLASFLTQHRQAGNYDSEGSFTLDPTLSWGKLQDAVNFLPGAFVLKIVQGLVGLGAQSLDCDITFSKITVSAQGCRDPEGGLLNRFQGPVGTVRDACDDLATGVLASLTQDIERVRWTIAGGESVVMESAGMERALKKNSTETTEFCFEFSQRFSLRTLQAVNETVSEHCQYSPAPLKAHVRLLPGHFAKPRNFGSTRYRYVARMPVFQAGGWDSHRPPKVGEAQHVFSCTPPRGTRDDDGLDCLFYTEACLAEQGLVSATSRQGSRLLSTVLFLDDTERRAGRLLLLQRGVVVHDEARNIGPSNSVVLTSCEGLDFDASTLRVVENDKYQALLGEVREQTAYLRRVMRANWRGD